MQNSKNISRNEFFKKCGVFFSLLAGAGILGVYMQTLKRFFHHSFTYRIPLQNIRGTAYVTELFFILKKGEEIRILSRKCPHLGCSLQINQRNNAIICPCHGSRFRLSGEYISGPARKNMTVLNHKTDSQNNVIIKTGG